MNNEIVVGFLNEHRQQCQHLSVSNRIKTKRSCEFCRHMNRDISLLMSNIHGARKTVDIGLALSAIAEINTYQPYKIAGFELLYQEGNNESERIKNTFENMFLKGYKTVIIISPSVPNLPVSYLESALSYLRKKENNLVLGPLKNGMFYLIGMKKKMYETVNRSVFFNKLNFYNSAMRDTTVNMIKDYCNDCSILPEWYTLKSLNDLKKLHYDFLHGIGWKAQWTHNITNELL